MADQSSNIPWTKGMNYGLGVNLVNGDIAGKAIDPGQITGPTGAGGQTVTYNLTQITSFEELYSSMGMSVEVAGQYGLFNATGKFQYAKESKFNSQATFLLSRCVVENAFTQAENAVLLGDAIDLIKRGKMDTLQARYGDGFVRGMQTGGEFISVISITSTSQELQESISSSLQAKYNGLFAKGEVDVSLDIGKKTKISKSKVSISSFQRGGIGDELSITTDVESVLARLKAFPAEVQRNPVPYEVQVASYNTLALPDGPNLIDIEAQKFALTDYARIQLKLLSSRNDVDFLTLHPDFFENPPAASVVGQWAQFITDEINRVVRQASACSNDAVGSCGLMALKMPDDFAMPKRKPNLCPKVSGVYKRADGGRTIQFIQDGFSITCVDLDPSYEHHGEGDWNGNAFDYAVMRKNIATGCVTQMLGEITLSPQGQLTVNITGSDGSCDLPRNFSDTAQWNKV